MIYSTLPFIFGLKSLNPVRDLEQFGLETNATTGLFYAISGASKVYVLATIVLFNSYKFFSNSIINKLFWFISVILGTYFVYSSWTRTGWFLFIFALGFSFFYGGTLKRKFIAVLGTLILIFAIYSLYESNQAFRWRLSGGAVYRTNTELSIDQLAKARVPFIITALDNLKDEGLMGQFMGYGEQHTMDLFKNKTGMAIVSHNKTFEILEASGILGLLIFILFLFHLFRRIFSALKYFDLQTKKLLLVSFILFMGYNLTSHGSFIWTDVIFAPIFSVFILAGRNRHLKIPQD
ncbi:hypothetical protein [Winogradskyella sp. A2]|uniref:hypothetical protein n=1 Tax=Winogradskyella sp. A2 TaxID=3366944 RepID=UPI00398C7B6A